jgi:uncharacterized protein
MALVVRKSPIHGRGLFATRALSARRKLGELTGELVEVSVARRTIERQPIIYYVELTRRRALDCTRGNAFKHLNHSCAPNCYLRTVGYRVEVYTLRAIRSGEELTIDYVLTPHRGGMLCGCDSPRCRQRL